MSGLTLDERETWRALIAAARQAMDTPTLMQIQRLGKAAQKAGKTVIPPPRDEARTRLFAQLVRVSSGYGPSRKEELAGLVGMCEPVIEAQLQPRGGDA